MSSYVLKIKGGDKLVDASRALDTYRTSKDDVSILLRKQLLAKYIKKYSYHLTILIFFSNT